MTRPTTILACVLLACLPRPGSALQLDLATLSCAGYHQVILNAESPVPHPDSIDLVMWLLGYSVANSGAHVMYSDALASFGFALDAECFDRPASSLLTAIGRVRPRNTTPLDLTALSCREFEERHAKLRQSDPESADTIMNWLRGFATARAGSTVLDTGGLRDFEDALSKVCEANGQESLYDALNATGAVRGPP